MRDEKFSRFYDRSERIVGTDIAETRIDRADAQHPGRASGGIAGRRRPHRHRRLLPHEPYRCAAGHRRANDDGMVSEVTVEGWDDRAYLAAGAHARAVRSMILSPFDPLVFCRPRALRLFDFHYRIGRSTPAHKRVHGYYVHPYLLGDDIAAGRSESRPRHRRAAGARRASGAGP